MEFAHVHVWNHCPTMLGGSDLKQISIDESFWQRGRTNKNMAPGSRPALTEPHLDWGVVKVGKDGKNRRCLFRIIRKTADTVDGKPRGTAELTRLTFHVVTLLCLTVGKQHVQFRGGISVWPTNIASTAVEPRRGSAHCNRTASGGISGFAPDFFLHDKSRFVSKCVDC